MTYRGKVKNGVIVLEGKKKLPDGTRVVVKPRAAPRRKPARSKKSAVDPVYRLGDRAVRTGIPDLSINIDHYLYGHPKVSDGAK
jgi:hypothetical protein